MLVWAVLGNSMTGNMRAYRPDVVAFLHGRVQGGKKGKPRAQPSYPAHIVGEETLKISFVTNSTAMYHRAPPCSFPIPYDRTTSNPCAITIHRHQEQQNLVRVLGPD